MSVAAMVQDAESQAGVLHNRQNKAFQTISAISDNKGEVNGFTAGSACCAGLDPHAPQQSERGEKEQSKHTQMFPYHCSEH